jgi:hypothetical protein
VPDRRDFPKGKDTETTALLPASCFQILGWTLMP